MSSDDREEAGDRIPLGRGQISFSVEDKHGQVPRRCYSQHDEGAGERMAIA